MRHQADLERRSSSPIFSEHFWDLSLLCWYMRGWWILGQSYTTCSAVSSPIPHYLQLVLTARPILCRQYLSSGWWPLLRRPIIVCSFLDNFDFSLLPSFTPLMPYTRRIPSWGFSPHRVACLMATFAET